MGAGFTRHGGEKPRRANAPPWVKIVRADEAPGPTRTRAEMRALGLGEETALAKAVCAAFEMPAAMARWLALLLDRSRCHSAVAAFEGHIVGGAS